MKNNDAIATIKNDRRQFIKNVSGALFYISVPFGISLASSCKDENSKEKDQEDYVGKEVNIWVQIHENDTITLVNPANEMGQGSMTALAVIIAEELDADWSKIQIEDSLVDAERYGSPGFSGKNSMITAGSRTVMSYYDMLRQAGAQARYCLLSNVAKHWNIPIQELSTEPNIVVHNLSNKRISYGEIAAFLKPLENIPEIPTEQLKKPKDFRIIGKEAARLDIPEKVNGSATFGIDVQLPNITYAVISRSPVNGSTPNLINEEVIRNKDGVLDIVKLDHGIGIIAESIEKALKAKSALEIEWSTGAKAEGHTSNEAYVEYEKTASDTSIDDKAIINKGDIKRALRTGSKTYSSDYKNDYIYHAQMEPLSATISIAKDGSSAEVWVGTQSPVRTLHMIAEMLDLEVSQVTMHRCFMGGGFGRRADSDWVSETVQLAKKATIKRPVKLIWTREDDVQYGMFRPMSLQRMRASVDSSGNVIGWQHIIVGTGGRLLSSGAKTDFYTFPNQHVEVRNIDHGIRTRHWRAVGHGPNKFAIEAFVDELATDQNVDPFDFRIQLMKNHPRAQKVLQTVADMADWKSPASKGRAKGIAFAERSGSLAACVCELSLNTENGKIEIHQLWASLDAGVVVQPDNAIAQMEGALLMGMSSILKEQITFKNGAVQQSNFHDYPILRMDEIPQSIEIKLIASDEKPTGIGESGIPILGGAIANALAKLTGKRIKHLPFTPASVLEVLKSS